MMNWSSINELEFDRWNAICRKMLSLNKHRINKGVRRSRNPQRLQDIYGSVSDVKESGE